MIDLEFDDAEDAPALLALRSVAIASNVAPTSGRSR
jgi:hypothetical protein